MGDKGTVIDIRSLLPKNELTEKRSSIYSRDIFNDLKSYYKAIAKDGQFDELFDGLAEALVGYLEQKRGNGSFGRSFEDFSVEHVFPVAEKMRELKMFSEAADLAGLVRGLVSKYGR